MAKPKKRIQLSKFARSKINQCPRDEMGRYEWFKKTINEGKEPWVKKLISLTTEHGVYLELRLDALDMWLTKDAPIDLDNRPCISFQFKTLQEFGVIARLEKDNVETTQEVKDSWCLMCANFSPIIKSVGQYIEFEDMRIYPTKPYDWSEFVGWVEPEIIGLSQHSIN